MKIGSVVLGVLGAVGLGGIALAMGQKEERAGTGKQFALTFATSRPITDTDLGMIQRAMVTGKAYGDIQGIAISGDQQFKANVSFPQGRDYAPKVGAVGVLGSNPNDAITIQLIAVDKVS